MPFWSLAGIIAVYGIPEVAKVREAVFRDGYTFANMDQKVKQLYEHEASYYSFGWSHGKEKLQVLYSLGI